MNDHDATPNRRRRAVVASIKGQASTKNGVAGSCQQWPGNEKERREKRGKVKWAGIEDKERRRKKREQSGDETNWKRVRGGRPSVWVRLQRRIKRRKRLTCSVSRKDKKMGDEGEERKLLCSPSVT